MNFEALSTFAAVVRVGASLTRQISPVHARLGSVADNLNHVRPSKVIQLLQKQEQGEGRPTVRWYGCNVVGEE